MISEDQKIDLDKLIQDFVQMVDENSANLSTDPDVKRVKIIRVDEYDCPGCRVNLDDE